MEFEVIVTVIALAVLVLLLTDKEKLKKLTIQRLISTILFTVSTVMYYIWVDGVIFNYVITGITTILLWRIVIKLTLVKIKI